MLFDDRLATVLRFPAQSELAARTQYRQLLDLLGSMPHDAPSELARSAYERLGDLAGEVPPAMQSAILRAPGLRLRSPALVAWLAQSEPQAAAAAMATAQLADEEWVQLIPRLPLTARGFLRHRRDLPKGARQVLDRLGVGDLVLPRPESPPEDLAQPVVSAPREDPGIGALVRRIEAFQQARRKGPASPRLPLDDKRQFEQVRRSRAFDFSTDAQGMITWADPAMAPMVVGLTIGPARPGALAALDESGARAIGRRLPLRGVSLTMSGAAEIAGEWRIDAAPAFSPDDGRFVGYNGRMRRPLPASAPPTPEKTGGAGDRMRQLLHELRTPANAIQGFAEMIQQQMFGPVPNEYRALAAAVAVDSAKLMAGFDEIDRLVRLQSGALELSCGQCDLREVVSQLVRRLDGVLKPRSARIDFLAEGLDFTIGIDRTEALQLAWRLLATLAGSLSPGEIVDLSLQSEAGEVTMTIELPGSMLGDDDLFAATATVQPRAILAGMFGSGFTLRLARAEAEAAGGRLEQQEDRLRLALPALTETRVTLDTTGIGGSFAGQG